MILVKSTLNRMTSLEGAQSQVILFIFGHENWP